MSAYVIFDVEIRDMSKYQEFVSGVKPAIEAAGAKYLLISHEAQPRRRQPKICGAKCIESYRLPAVRVRSVGPSAGIL